ncbi:MAG: hypothetical protein ACFCUE_07895 [Candidatus Bathyarchaeia archaeon]|jgi:hypothetical protein
MARPKKAPSTNVRALEPDPWCGKIKLKKRIDTVAEDDPIGT